MGQNGILLLSLYSPNGWLSSVFPESHKGVLVYHQFYRSTCLHMSSNCLYAGAYFGTGISLPGICRSAHVPSDWPATAAV